MDVSYATVEILEMFKLNHLVPVFKNLGGCRKVIGVVLV